jgi:tetratricopeptide (TPR) repeat protein
MILAFFMRPHTGFHHFKIVTMRVLLLLFGLAFLPVVAAGQDARLAQQYYQDGEFEKAAVLYERLYQEQNQNEYFFDRYLECLLAVEKYGEVEEVLKKELKNNPKNIRLYVSFGNLYERQFKEVEAQEQYQKAIKKLTADQYEITRLASAFSTLMKYELAIKTYEVGGELLKDKLIFAYNLAELYRRMGDVPKMIENYLNSVEANPEHRLNSVKSQLQRYLLTDTDYTELQTQLYARIQSDQDALHYVELLQWVFIQNKDYKNAFRQAKALDKRLGENGARVYQLAVIAFNDKDYDAAIEAYQYIIQEKGFSSTFYLEAQKEALRARRNKLVEGFKYTEPELREIEKAYESFLNEFGRNKTTATIVAELADLEAFYLNDLPKAITLLDEMTDYPAIDVRTQSVGKLSLGDFYLMQGEIWESTLLYSQVDKIFPDDQLGHEARFRNAKLSYYNGDFQWAQAQFDVLKASTSKLIANDALDLSVFIMDNMGLDTTDRALQLYAEADLLTFQNRFEEAFSKLDTLIQAFPSHSLEDDVLYARAKVFSRKKDYPKAAEMYKQVIEKYPEEIRADNALFELAELYETHLNDIEKAKELYEKIFIDYASSTFSVEARKRFRKLRGDNI